MVATYRRTTSARAAERVLGALARAGISPGGICSLTVRGRTSGQPRTTPVTPLELGGRVHLVAPYGEVNWVRNLRAAGEATIQRGSAHRIRATELPPAEAAPVLREYVRRLKMVQPYVPAGPDDDLAAFEAITPRFPVFSIERIG